MTKLLLEQHGFNKFFNKAYKQLEFWYRDRDLKKIKFFASREWSVMSEKEQQYFIKSYVVSTNNTSNVNSYLNFLLSRHYSNIRTFERSSFDPTTSRETAKIWHNMSVNERNIFTDTKMTDLSMDHVIKQRDKLHQLYDLNRLILLEYILKTKPKRTLNAKNWLLMLENSAVNSSTASWSDLSDDDKKFYNICTQIDRRRFLHEKRLWLSNMLSIDFGDDEFTLPEFESKYAKDVVMTLDSLIYQNKNLLPRLIFQKPLNPFSLFLKDYKDGKKFVLGKHLKDASEAWSKLSEDEKKPYQEASIELKKAYDLSASLDILKKLYNKSKPEQLKKHLENKGKMREKALFITKLIKESHELEKIKQDLHLIKKPPERSKQLKC